MRANIVEITKVARANVNEDKSVKEIAEELNFSIEKVEACLDSSMYERLKHSTKRVVKNA